LSSRVAVIAARAVGTAVAFAVVGGFAATAPAVAGGETSSFSGSCAFSGPITPMPPITVVPHAGARFSYAGVGSCQGTLNGVAVAAAPMTVTFTNVATFFDTCEVGPDFNLQGTATIGTGASRDLFAITINLARLALAGPFAVTTPGGGLGLGVATFQPPDPTAAVQACAGSGVATATLAGNFTTVTPLVGVSG
jgi:hypothetical protein